MPTSQDDAIALIEEYTEELNAGHYDSLDQFFVDDFDERDENAQTVVEILEQERDWAETFRDKHEETDEILTPVEDRDEVSLAVWYSVTGTHTGVATGIPPTGNEVKFAFSRRFEFQDGNITRYGMGKITMTIGFLLELGLDWMTLTDEVDVEANMTSPEQARGKAQRELLSGGDFIAET